MAARYSGACDMQFSLWDAQGAGSPPTGGTQIGSNDSLPGVNVSNGLFTVVVNNAGQFGASAFNAQERWLQVAVQCGSDPVYTPLSRQAITAAPYASYATGNWGLNGNGGSNPNTNFLGTTDNVSLTLGANGAAALRLVPIFGAPVIIGGYSGNVVRGTFDGATIGGGGSNLFGGNVISGSNVSWSTIGGGVNNRIVGSAYNATIGGGYSNVISGSLSDAGRSVIAGGFYNRATGYIVTIAGGESNTASGDRSTVGGGWTNTAVGAASTIGGGQDNKASNNYSSVGGGFTNKASGADSTVSGGVGNTASGSGSTVSGGGSNTASGATSIVGGGVGNTASGNWSIVNGGYSNTATVAYSTVSGGVYNTAGGYGSMVPGGNGNATAGAYSFAAGWNAHALHDGAFVWADTANLTAQPISSTAPDQFLVRASGGITLFTNPDATSGVMIAHGSSSWNVASDRNAKMNFDTVDGRAVLAALAAIPVETWNYKTQEASIRHMGPMAQDFYSAFGVGENDTTISTVDAQGVALAAIQGLYQVVQEKDARIAALEAHVSALEQQHTGSAPAVHNSPSLELLLMAGMFGLNLVLGALVVMYAQAARR